MSTIFEQFLASNTSLSQIIGLLPIDSEISLTLDERTKYTMKVTEEGPKVENKESYVADINIDISSESLRLLNQNNQASIPDFLTLVFKEILSGGIKFRLLKDYSQLVGKGYMKVFEFIGPYMNQIMASEGYQNFIKLVDLAKRIKNRN